MRLLNSFIVSNSSHFFGYSSDSSLNSNLSPIVIVSFKFTMTGEMVALCFVNKSTSAPVGRQRGAILDGEKSAQWSWSSGHSHLKSQFIPFQNNSGCLKELLIRVSAEKDKLEKGRWGWKGSVCDVCFVWILYLPVERVGLFSPLLVSRSFLSLPFVRAM